MKARVAIAMILAGCSASPTAPEVDLGFEIPDTWQAGEQVADEVATAWWNLLGAEGLDRIVAEALTNNRDLQATAARVFAAEAQARIAGAELYPQINAGLTGIRQRQNFIGIPALGPGVRSITFDNFGVALNLSWELDLWGRIRSGQAAAIADFEAAAADYHAAQLSLIAQTAKVWFAIAEGRHQLALAQQTIANFRQTSEQVRNRFSRGVRPSLDLRLALANLSAAEAIEEQRQEQLQRVLRQMEILLGRYPQGSLAEAKILPGQLPPIPPGLPSGMLGRRPDLLAAQRRLAAADSRLSQARAARLPRFSLTTTGGTASSELQDLTDLDFRVWTLVGNIVQPIFQGGRLQAEVMRNDALTQEAIAIYASAALRALSEVETGLAIDGHLARQESHLRAAADQSIAARDISEDRYLRGLEDFLTVAETQRNALTAESLWLRVRRLRLAARIDLHLALGGGFTVEEDLDS